MKILNVARIFHENKDTRKDFTISCSCGHYGKIKYSPYQSTVPKCPSCNTDKILASDKYFNGWTKKGINHLFFDIEMNVQAKEIYVKKTNIHTTMIFDEETIKNQIKIKKIESFELFFNAEKPNDIKLLVNGENVIIKKQKLCNALSHIDLSIMDFENRNKFKNSIFESYYLMSKDSLLSNIVYALYTNPQFEILYNTYGSLENFKNCPIREFKSGNSPSEIFRISKPIWNEIFKINQTLNNGNIYFQLDTIRQYEQQLFNKPDIIIKILDVASSVDISMLEKFFELYNLNYNFDRLRQYLLEDIYTYQGIDSPKEGFQILYDYIHMCQLMDISFDKYPKSLKLSHDMANKNLKIQVSDIEAREMELVLNSEEYKELAYDDKKNKYIVILPKDYKDIINEGKQLHHCVGSYVDLVKNKKTKIVFMRERNDVEKSLITLEVRNEILRQYAGFGDRTPNKEEMDFIKKYCKEKNFKISENHAEYYVD